MPQTKPSECLRKRGKSNPPLHTASEWPDVVSRMHVNMQRMGVTPPTEDAR